MGFLLGTSAEDTAFWDLTWCAKVMDVCSVHTTQTLNMGFSAPTVSLCGIAVAAGKHRNLEALLSLLSENCPVGAEEQWPAGGLKLCCSREHRCFPPPEHLSLVFA